MENLTKKDTKVLSYQESITRNESMANELVKYGQLQPASSRLGIDKLLKRNYLQEYALTKPREYIQNRYKLISKLKEDVDRHYVDVFTKYTSGDSQLPHAEAGKIAFQACANLMNIEMDRIEALYPSQFADEATKRQLDNIMAGRKLEISGEQK